MILTETETKKLAAVAAHAASLSDEGEKERYLAESFTAAEQAGEGALQAGIARLIIGAEEAERLSVGLRMSCLMFLIDRFFVLREEVAEHSPQADALMEDFYQSLWTLKWVVPDLPLDLEIAREGIEGGLDIMRHYYDVCGLSDAPVHKAAMLQHMLMGERQAAQAAFGRWQHTEADEMGDCEACEATEKVNYYSFVGQYEQALAEAEPILSGRLHCGEVPEISYAPVLFSMIQLQRFEEARQLLPRAVAAVENNSNTIAEISKLIEMAVRLGEFELAKSLADRHRQAILAKSDAFAAMRFYIASAFFSEEDYRIAAELAALFDGRNGNRYYSDYLSALTGRQENTAPILH